MDMDQQISYTVMQALTELEIIKETANVLLHKEDLALINRLSHAVNLMDAFTPQASVLLPASFVSGFFGYSNVDLVVTKGELENLDTPVYLLTARLNKRFTFSLVEGTN